SPKRSMTMGRYPARRAASASERAESATIRTERCSANKLARQDEGVTKIEVERLVALDHPAQQPGLDLVLDVADGKRADTERLRARDRLAVVLQPDALDAGRRDGVDVGCDLEGRRLGELGLAQHLDAGLARREHHI